MEFPTDTPLEDFLKAEIEEYEKRIRDSDLRDTKRSFLYRLCCSTAYGDSGSVDIEKISGHMYEPMFQMTGRAALPSNEFKKRIEEMNQMIEYCEAITSEINKRGGWTPWA
jgi:hypothetical protein